MGVTLTTVKLSHWYMGNTDTPKRVVVADLRRDDRIARSSEYRLKVSGTERTFETEVVGGLFNVVDHRRFGSGGWYTHFVNVQQGRDEENRGSDSPMMFGRVPSQYTVRQFLPQWSPKLNRVFGIVRHQAAATAGMSAGEGATAAPAGTTAPASRPETAGGAASLEPLAFDWGQFAGPAGIRAAELGEAETLARLKGALQAVPGLQGAYVATEKKLIAVAGPAMGRVFASDVNVSRQQMYVPGGVVSQSADEFLNNICAHPNDGLFAVVSRLAPHGGGDFEDLPLLDVGDPAQWLLVICVERGDDLIVWRRLYGETGR
ncbi:MAG: hypothetical protein EHM42_07190 [Planctomycetaceae bacterium]|nr:MAG: hypothetical protein EHM42_07190 [Planctomycetaceae bacterium]